jgi:hypothetical protein
LDKEISRKGQRRKEKTKERRGKRESLHLSFSSFSFNRSHSSQGLEKLNWIPRGLSLLLFLLLFLLFFCILVTSFEMSSLEPVEIEFVAESTTVTIIPSFKMDKLHFISVILLLFHCGGSII